MNTDKSTQTSFFEALTVAAPAEEELVVVASILQPAPAMVLAEFRHYNEESDVQHWQVPEEEYIQKYYQLSLERARRNAQLSEEQLEAFNLHREGKKRIKAQQTLALRARYWKEAAERLAAAEGITEQARQGVHESYVELVKEAIKHGNPCRNQSSPNIPSSRWLPTRAHATKRAGEPVLQTRASQSIIRCRLTVASR